MNGIVKVPEKLIPRNIVICKIYLFASIVISIVILFPKFGHLNCLTNLDNPDPEYNSCLAPEEVYSDTDEVILNFKVSSKILDRILSEYFLRFQGH